MRGLLTFAVALLLTGLWAADSQAQSWRTCTGTHAAGRVVDGVVPQGGGSNPTVACYDFTGTTDSVLLSTAMCENIDIMFNPELDGTDTDAEVQVKWCASPSLTVANTCTIITNTTLDGVSSTATDAIYGAAAAWIMVDPSTTSGTDKARVLVKCNGPKS